jgi:hypothetical protein
LNDRTSVARHGVARCLIALMVALCLVVPALAGSGEEDEATQAAKKVAKARATSHQAEQEREALRHFQEEVAEYADLHARLLAKLERRESTATQEALARAIDARRAKAETGDIFRPEVRPLFQRLIAEQLEGPDALDARRAVIEGNPGLESESVPILVRVNAVYPPDAPRSTVPPSVLLTLPPLPPSLHYRFVGRDLILVDSVAQLIVDVLPAAAPDITIR